MNRRSFLSGSAKAAAAVAAAVAPTADAARPQRERPNEVYELQHITFGSHESRDRYVAYLREAYIPSAERARPGRTGIFAPEPDAASPTGTPIELYVLLSYIDMPHYWGSEYRIRTDTEYRRAGAAFLELPPTDPPYQHMESSLLRAFDGWRELKPPRETSANQPRVFELRTYESHSRQANLKKIEMFNAGEIGIFDRCGFQPVFFGEALVGPQVPNLTYMVTYPSIAERGAFWQAFGVDTEKQRLFAKPEYADKLIVSKIRAIYLKPLPGSQI